MVRALSAENERLKDTVDFLLNRLDERDEPRAVGVQDEAGDQRNQAGKRGVQGRGDTREGHCLRAKRKAIRPQNI